MIEQPSPQTTPTQSVPKSEMTKEEIRRQMYERIARGHAVGTSDCQAKQQLKK
jgi:hypothetical protein